MTHRSIRSNATPLAAPPFQALTHTNVQISTHAAMIAKFCASGKQHFAQRLRDPLRMAQTTINQTVAAALAYYMERARLNEAQLGRLAGVSPRTVGNFLRPHSRIPGSRGKEPSGKLTELAQIAAALQIDVADLVSTMTEQEREQRRRLSLAAKIILSGEAQAPSALDSKPARVPA